MSSRYQYPQFNEVGEVTNSSASLELVASPGSALYLNVERVAISVYRAAVGGGGIARLQDTSGNTIYTVNADGVKDVSLDLGDEGFQIGPNVGIQLVVGGAQGEQASVSCAISGHLTFRIA
jgi:hypothetical protein